MDSQTVNLIERPYGDIVDDLLTAIVGGVVNEPMIFDVKADLYPLAEPAQEIRGITGTVNQKPYTFLKNIDFQFDAGNNAVVWQGGGTWPDDETIFYVDYFRPNSRSPLTDINVGSVTRTLSEAIGREIATVYQQLNLTYLAGFIDTAEGKSLDFVVSILGITRKTADFAVGLATFFRDPAIKGNITIPVGVVLATSKGEASFETTEPRTLQRGQVRLDVPIRAGDKFKGEAGKVGAGEITEISQPLAGIARISNLEPTSLGATNESDEELRIRAKAALRGLGKGTLAALARVIFDGRANLVEVWDPNGPLVKQSPLGTVALLIESEPERFPSLRAAVEETRAAGVQATLVARYVFFKPRLEVKISAGLPAAGKTKVIEAVIGALQSYVDKLSSGDPALGEAMLTAVKQVEDVNEATFRDVISWRSDIGQPSAATLVDSLLNAIATTPTGDKESLRQALNNVVSEVNPLLPSNQRLVDRSLVQALDTGQPANFGDIDTGKFQVVAVVQGEKWWVVLDIEAADILLLEG